MILRFAFLFFFLIWSGFTASAEEWDCVDWESKDQTTMNICSHLQFQKVDGVLNEVWPVILKHMEQVDKASKDFFPEYANGANKLLQAQRAWIRFRDAHCETVGAQYAGGSIRPLIQNLCKEELTGNRIEQLESLMQEH